MSHILLTSIFWLGIVVTLYAYVGFPVLVSALATRKRGLYNSPARGEQNTQIPVTVVIPAYNEEQHLARRIQNVLACDHPREWLQVIVVSDASTDRTNEIARSFQSEGVQLIVQEQRRGKTAGLNSVLAVARGDVVVFTDANTTFPVEAIRVLVSYFQEPTVGLVTGFTKYTTTSSGELAEATNVYTTLERKIKRAESRWGLCVGADGAIFAMRRSLYRTLREDDINDLVLPLSVIRQGYKCLLAEDAYCSESTGKNVQGEFQRQSRIANRSLRAIYRNAQLLNPIRFPLFSYLLFSHKVTRLLAPLCLIASLASLAFLISHGSMYAWFAGAVSFLAVLWVVGKIGSAFLDPTSLLSRACRLVEILLVTNVAVLYGWWRFTSGHTQTTWQHDRAIEARER